MQVFKTYFRLFNAYKGIIIMYFVIFIAVALVMTSNSSLATNSEMSSEVTKLDIAIIDKDCGTLGTALRGYFGETHNLIDIEYEEEKILDELYWRKINYVLVIPEGLEESLLNDNVETMSFESMKVPGMFEADYFEAELKLYVQKLTGLLAAGYSMEDAEEELSRLQSQKAEVSFASFVNKKQNDACTIFFIYAPYLFITLGMNGVGVILLRFNARDVKDRMECSALTMKERVAGISAGILVFGLIMFAVILVIAGILSGGSIYADMRFPFFLLNLFSMLVFGLSLGFLTGTVAGNNEAVNGLVNIVSLGLCFLGGVFVPQQFFSDTIVKVSRFFPTYWYVATNEMIGEMKKLSSGLSGEIFSQIGLVFGYALVIFAITLVIISSQKTRRK
ncbi:MAG: ABC transporter permease [Lachnospiraceae bacterium]|nr:ABC transporter permease [Lachnospiraceae bacterium]